MPAKRKTSDISREEDFRDYDNRNIDEGWPYEDASGAGSREVDNAAYGQPKANFDSERNEGYRIDEADASGLEERLVDDVSPTTEGFEDADDLEEKITDALDDLAIVDMASIDVHVDDKRVTIEGEVDDAPTSGKIVRAVRAVPGVRMVINNLRLAGVDSGIPDED